MSKINAMHTWSFQSSTQYAYREGDDCEQFAADFAAQYPSMTAYDIKVGYLRQENIYSPYTRRYVRSTVIGDEGEGTKVVYARMELVRRKAA